MAIPRKLKIKFVNFGTMFTHHTKNKGDLGVLKAKVDLYEQGFMILNPETEHAPFDLVIYKNGVFKTVQVKYRSLCKNGTIEVVFRSTYCDTNGLVVKETDKVPIDIYAIYCPETDACYYFDPKKFNRSVSLRVSTSRNSQKAGIHNAESYREVP